jgi:hypothetical protein
MSSSLTEIVLPQRPPDMPCPTTVTDGDRLSLFIALEVVNDPAIRGAGGIRWSASWRQRCAR